MTYRWTDTGNNRNSFALHRLIQYPITCLARVHLKQLELRHTQVLSFANIFIPLYLNFYNGYSYRLQMHTIMSYILYLDMNMDKFRLYLKYSLQIKMQINIIVTCHLEIFLFQLYIFPFVFLLNGNNLAMFKYIQCAYFC